MKPTRAQTLRPHAQRLGIAAALFGAWMSWNVLPAHAAGNRLDEALHNTTDGKLRFAYAARPGVYGDGRSITIHGRYDGDFDLDWRYEPGPVRVVLSVHDGQVTRVKHSVGGRWSSTPRHTTDLGEVPARDAVAFLMTLAREERDSVAEDAIGAAALAADVEIWPQLLDIAKQRDRGREVRKAAIFWLGQAAVEAVLGDLDALAMDADDEIEVREAAVFAISQRPENESVPTLIRIARSEVHPAIRKSAVFWLSQADDPRVVEFFEEVLSDR